MKSSKLAALLAPLLLLAAATVSGDADASDTSIALGEVAVPEASCGVDHAALKSAAEGELRIVDVSKLRKRRNVLVSVAIIGSAQAPFAFTVNALLRDAKTGTMLAILEGRARAEGNVNPETRSKVLRAALHGAVRQIPEALAAN
jgi:hypothetical protein